MHSSESNLVYEISRDHLSRLAMIEAPVEEPETIPDAPVEPKPTAPAPSPDTDPFNPSWPDGRPEPQPKAIFG